MTNVSTQLDRSEILGFENLLKADSKHFVGDNEKFPLEHYFCEGMYARKIFIPAGSNLTGKIHKHDHPNFLLKGKVAIATEFGGIEYLEAPLDMISLAGTKRALHTITDTIWVTVHLNPSNTKDLTKLEEEIIAKNYVELDKYLEERKLIESYKNCGLEAIKNIFSISKISLRSLVAIAKDNGVILNAYQTLSEDVRKVPLPAIFHSENHFSYIERKDQFEELKYSGIFLSTENLEYLKFKSNVSGSTWVAIGVAVGSAAVAFFGTKKSSSGSSASDIAAEHIAELEAQKAAADAEAAKQKTKTLLIVGGIVLVLVVFAFIYFKFIKH